MNTFILNNAVEQPSKNLTGFFCHKCEIIFPDEKTHKSHYRSELHNYNLRRIKVELKPVSEEVFLAKKAGTLKRNEKLKNIQPEYKETPRSFL